MRHRSCIALLALLLVACGSLGPIDSPRQPPAGLQQSNSPAGLLIYGQPIGSRWEPPYQPELVVASPDGRRLRTINLPGVVSVIPTYAPNRAIYVTDANQYLLVDAAQGTAIPLAINVRSTLAAVALAPDQGRRWMLLVAHPTGKTGLGKPGVPSTFLIDLDQAVATDLFALTGARAHLDVELSTDGSVLLAIIDDTRLAVIPTAQPDQLRELDRGNPIAYASFSPDGQTVLYTRQHVIFKVGVAGGEPKGIVADGFERAEFMRDPTTVLLAGHRLLAVFDLATGEQRVLLDSTINSILYVPTLVIGATDDHVLIRMEYTWQLVDLRSGAVTPLTALNESGPRSIAGRRWVVFGTRYGGDVIRTVPPRIVDLQTGAISADLPPLGRQLSDPILDIAPDGSAMLIAVRPPELGLGQLGAILELWLYTADAAPRKLYQAKSLKARFSPDGEHIVITGIGPADTGLNPTVIDRAGKPLSTLGEPGVQAVWLAP